MLALPAATQPLTGVIHVVGDKSLSHRALMLGAWAEGPTTISNLLQAEDVWATRRAIEALGARVTDHTAQGERRVVIEGTGGHLTAPAHPIDCQNAGTAMRLLSGLMVAGNVEGELRGDASLHRRPMGRLIDVLTQLGATIEANETHRPPLYVRHRGPLALGPLTLGLPSAQLASAALFAALGGEGALTLTGMGAARDHTQRMLSAFGAQIAPLDGGACRMQGTPRLVGQSLRIPGDPSSAAVWVAAATLIGQSDIILPGICINETRTGFVSVLRRMGARIDIAPQPAVPEDAGEPVGALRIRASTLSGCRLAADEVPSLIDELPLLAVVATAAYGITTVTGAAQLRVKESDRIQSTCALLRAMGARIHALPDGFAVEGPTPLRAASLFSSGDHRIAMAAAVAASMARGTSTLTDHEVAAVSYPGFWRLWQERIIKPSVAM